MTTTSHISISVLILFLCLTTLSFSERCHPNDKKALLQLKKDLNNPYDLISWKPKTDCCTWRVVKCDKKTNRITEFDLSKSNLHLPIPAAVGDLPYLQSLTFHQTNLTGQIPRAISKLSNLKFLQLRQNLLTGSVPALLGHLKKLTYIDLSSNSLTGSIPASLSQLPELATLDVSRNRLEGDLSLMLGKSKSLVSAYFSGNLFEFDLSNVKFSENLFTLDLNHNKIYGSLPKDLGSTGIINLNVSYNRLCGPIPEVRRAQLFDISAFLHNKCLCGKPLPECK